MTKKTVKRIKRATTKKVKRARATFQLTFTYDTSPPGRYGPSAAVLLSALTCGLRDHWPEHENLRVTCMAWVNHMKPTTLIP